MIVNPNIIVNKEEVAGAKVPAAWRARHPFANFPAKERYPVSEDRKLQKMAFPFIQVAPRPSKPREKGLTIVADRGIGMHRVEDLLETAGEYIDYFKIAIGAYRLQSEALIKRKVAALHKAGTKVFFAGDVSEAAIMQGVIKDFYKTVKKFGAEAVEVSNAQIAISLQDKCELIRMATAQGLKVVA